MTDYAQTKTLLSDPRLIKGGWQSAVFANKLPESVASGIHSTMLNNDPPTTPGCAGWCGALSRRRVEQLVPRIQQMTHALLDRDRRRERAST